MIKSMRETERRISWYMQRAWLCLTFEDWCVIIAYLHGRHWM